MTPATGTDLACFGYLAYAQVTAVAAGRAPLLLNLGGDPLSDAVAEAARTRHVVFAQTNLAEHDAHHADQLAAELFASLEPEQS